MRLPITLWFMQRGDELADQLDSVRAKLEVSRGSDGSLYNFTENFALGLVNALEGNTAETERLIRRWQRGVVADVAEKVFSWAYGCRTLGIAGATIAAVDCIRTGLAEASLVMPFLEPHPPFYDGIRQEAAFVELVDGL